MIKKLDAKLALLLTVVATLIVLLVGWFGLITSERSKASKVDTQISQQQDQLTAANALIATTTKAKAEAQFRAAEKVLPEDPRMSQVVRQFSAAAVIAGVQVDGVVPAAVTTVGTAQAVPLTVTVEGQYFAIRHFLALLQSRATMKNDKVVGDGRLYSVDNIQFSQAAQNPAGSSSDATLGTSGAAAPTVKNTLTAVIAANVFIAGAPPAPTATTTTTATDSGATTGDTTTTASGTTP